MTVTVTVDETTARGMFGQVCGDASESSYCALMPGCPCKPPSVRYIVVDSPLACDTCGGWKVAIGAPRDVGEPWPTCSDCSGTGLPRVQIVSDDRYLMPHIVHGTIIIGTAVPIEQASHARSGGPHICIGIHGQFLHAGDTFTNITGPFGSQAVTPGRWAHSILEAS